MKLIKGNRFKINSTEYEVTGVWFKEGERSSIEFRNTDWDKEVKHYAMPASEFDKKVSFEQYVG